jgi:hypothetical protein
VIDDIGTEMVFFTEMMIFQRSLKVILLDSGTRGVIFTEKVTYQLTLMGSINNGIRIIRFTGIVIFQQ